jgi:hypothetical protein
LAPIVEVNGYDETGIIGKHLRFVRIGMTIENNLRPYVYNLLHFRSVSATKRFLGGISDSIKIDYVKKVMNDPAISITQYLFSTDHQIDVLRQFTLLEEKSLYGKRGELIYYLRNTGDYRPFLEDLAIYLKRYERAPYWMESFMKSYGFRMIIEDLKKTSNVLSDHKITDYRVVSYVDGGFPFVFWWRRFLELQDTKSRFSLQKTPIYGVTKGDEYYPATSMAGNIAFITSTVSGMVYPHNVADLPQMNFKQLNEFYNLFSQKTSVPTFQKRVLFVGSLHRDFQYLIPYMLHVNDNFEHVYEPFRLTWKEGGTLKAFYRTFGRYPQNDIVVIGGIRSEEDKEIIKECMDIKLDCRPAQEFLGLYRDLLDEIQQESEISNLSFTQRQKIAHTISFAKQKAAENLK